MHVRTLANIALAAAALGCVSFVVLYSRLAAWWKSELGRNVMAFMAVAGILLIVALMRAFIPFFADYIEWLRLVSFTVVSYIVWRRVYLLLKAQRMESSDSP